MINNDGMEYFVKTQSNHWLNNAVHFPRHQIFMAIIHLVLDIISVLNLHQNTIVIKCLMNFKNIDSVYFLCIFLYNLLCNETSLDKKKLIL